MSSTVKLTYLQGCWFGKLKLNENDPSNLNQQKEKPLVKMILLVDNSASMGQNTRLATQTIGKAMFNLDQSKIDTLPGTIIFFDNRATIISDNIESPGDIDKIHYPSQGRTNITAGIQMAVNHIMSYGKSNVHYIITFLSDGDHNSGPMIDMNLARTMRQKLDEYDIRLSVIVVGVTSNSDTKLGMIIKTGLENVEMKALESVYYAKNMSDMYDVLSKLNEGCAASIVSGKPSTIRLESDHVFLQTENKNLSAFLSGGETSFIIECRCKACSNNNSDFAKDFTKDCTKDIPNIFVEDQRVELEFADLTEKDISTILGDLLPSLSRTKVAKGTESIRKKVEKLDKIINFAEKFFEEIDMEGKTKNKEYNMDNVGKIKMKPHERLQIIKNVKRVRTRFSEDRNILQSLLVQLENDSSKQAQYLTGINKKYSAKAVIRAGTMDKSVQDIIREIDLILNPIVKHAESSMISSAKNDNDNDNDNQNENTSTSILSLNTAAEQLAEWRDSLKSLDDSTDIYDILVAFGIVGYSVKFQHNNAVQMDPFQTECERIEPCPVDTSNILLANQMQREIYSHSRTPITDCLILVDPSCPKACIKVMKKSPVYKYLCSVVLCRDLYMYHPKMTFSMHSHSLIKAVDSFCGESNYSGAYLDLAIRISYSIRKYWGNYAKEIFDSELNPDGSKNPNPNIKLFKHWFEEWDTITQSNRDECNHPAQLLLMLSAFDLTEIGVEFGESKVPLINMLNEVLARIMKQKLSNISMSGKFGKDSTNTIGIKLMQKLFGITPENSPQPDPDVMVKEPTYESLRESCAQYSDSDNSTSNNYVEVDEKEAEDILTKFLSHKNHGNSIQTLIKELLMPYVRTYHFAHSIQKYVSLSGGYDSVCSKIESERAVPKDMLEYIRTEMKTIEKCSVLDYMGVEEKEKERVSRCMLVQAVLNHDSSSRSETIVAKDVLFPDTFHNLIVDLRMCHYMEAAKIKNEKWAAIIGDITYVQALECSLDQYEKLIGNHTHGHPGSVFWSLLYAAEKDEEKQKIFLNRSSSCVIVCIDNMKRGVKRK